MKMQNRATMCPREAQGLPASQSLLHGCKDLPPRLPHPLVFTAVLCVPQEQPFKAEKLSMSCFHPPLGCHRYESNCVTQLQSTHKAHLGLYRKDPQFPQCLYRFFHSVVFGCLVTELSLCFKNRLVYHLLGCTAKEGLYLSQHKHLV